MDIRFANFKQDAEKYIKLFDGRDWEAYDFTEAQHLHRMEQRALAMCV